MAVMVETLQYSGPAEILLKMVVEHEVDIWDISLAELVERYLVELDNHTQNSALDLDEATELLMIAAILIELKSRGLLPREEEEVLEELPDGVFDSLIAKMLECRTFRAVSAVLEEMSAVAARSTPRCYGLDSRFLELMPDLLANVSPQDLRDAYMHATAPKKLPIFSTHHISPITRTVPETVEMLSIKLMNEGKMTFKEITAEEDRIGIVFCFLAILELYKTGMADITQAHTFGEIQIEWVVD